MGVCHEEESQEGVCLGMKLGAAACYLLLFLASAGLLAHKFSRERERKWQILFHSFVMASCLGRMSYFVLGAVQERLPFKAENVLLDTIPAFLLFSSYFVLLFFWAELYHNNTGRLGHFRPHYILLNVAMYSLLFSLLLLDLLLYCPLRLDPGGEGDCSGPTCAPGCPPGLSPVEVALHSLTAMLFLILGFSYALYGSRLYRRFALLPAITSERHRSHRRVVLVLAFVTLLFTSFFFVRAAIVLVWILQDLTFLVWFDPVYYFFLEILPITMLFYVFYRTASSKGSPQKNGPGPAGNESSHLINHDGD